MAEKTPFLAQKCNLEAFFELSGPLAWPDGSDITRGHWIVYIKGPRKWVFGWVEKSSIDLLKILARAYTSYAGTRFQKKIWFLRLVYQIDRFLALIEDPQTKIATNAYFGH